MTLRFGAPGATIGAVTGAVSVLTLRWPRAALGIGGTREVSKEFRSSPFCDRGNAMRLNVEEEQAIAFAILAWAHLTDRPAGLPPVTGAARAKVLGSFVPGSGGRR